MENLEKVEKIREKTGVSYEEAKKALEDANYDMLDAIIELEKQGKINKASGSYSTALATSSDEFEQAQKEYKDSIKGESLGGAFDRFFKWIAKLLKRSLEIDFVASKDGQQKLKFPLLVLILLICFAFWIVIPVMIIGLFCDFKYRFEGVDEVNVNVNDLCDRASNTCNNIKNDFKAD